MVASCGGSDVGDCVTRLASVNGSRQCYCRGRSHVERSNIPNSIGVGSLGCRVASQSESSWKRIGQRNVGRLSRAIVGDFNLEDDGVAFGWSAISAGQCFDGDQVSRVVNDNRFVQVIADGGRIDLIARCCSCDIGDGVAALASVDCTFER